MCQWLIPNGGNMPGCSFPFIFKNDFEPFRLSKIKHTSFKTQQKWTCAFQLKLQCCALPLATSFSSSYTIVPWSKDTFEPEHCELPFLSTEKNIMYLENIFFFVCLKKLWNRRGICFISYRWQHYLEDLKFMGCGIQGFLEDAAPSELNNGCNKELSRSHEDALQYSGLELSPLAR